MIPAAKSTTLRDLVQREIERWRCGGRPNAAAVIAEHPELRQSKSLVMDLALAEFSFRNAAGDRVLASELGDRIPDYRQSIVRMLQVQDYLDQFPHFAAEDRVRWPTPGDEFLGYEIVEPLGRGGLARVFLAREMAVGGRFVVIKVSRLGSREAHTLGKLSHPSIMPIHSVQHDAEDGWTVICMPLLGVATAIDLLDAAFAQPDVMQNGELVAHVARQTLPMERVPRPPAGEAFDWHVSYAEAIARVGLQLAEALEAAHAAGILHRDIKPSNVLFAWSGRPLLLDFNLSSADGQEIGGTLPYMAPERVARFLHEPGRAASRFDPRCDLYSLGVVLYELLAGRMPGTPDDAEKLPLDDCQAWLQVKRGPIQSLAGDKCVIDPRLEAIVMKCLAFDPAERYATAAYLAADLRSLLGIKAHRNRVRRRWALVAAAAVLATGGAGYAIYQATRPPPWEAHYRLALAQYDQGAFEPAVESFTRCLQLKPGWPDAHFGRAQAFRQLGKLREARTDFNAIADHDRAWAFALSGYCALKLGQHLQAWSDFLTAHRAGLRDIGFLLNYATTEMRRQKHAEAIKLYSEVLEIDPHHKLARQKRVWAQDTVVGNFKRLPPQQAVEDAHECVRAEPDSFEAAYTAAHFFAQAARRDPRYEQDAVRYLVRSVRLGLPLDRVLVPGQGDPLKRLVPFVDSDVLLSARPRPPGYWRDRGDIADPPTTAHWNAFRLQMTNARPLLAQNN